MRRTLFTNHITSISIPNIKIKISPYDGKHIYDLVWLLSTLQLGKVDRWWRTERWLLPILRWQSGRNKFQLIFLISISWSFNYLSIIFLKHYSIYVEKEVSDTNMWTMSQKKRKRNCSTLSSANSRMSFNIVVSDGASISALRNALWYESHFREELLLNKSATLEDSLYRALKYIEMEWEKKLKKKAWNTISWLPLFKVPLIKNNITFEFRFSDYCLVFNI